ncbi:thioesterase II family protein [Spirillospora sp. NBC_01491]|uniref:thioesterase II family protein n=1 Tax=Spirillospora sp. NBC_01491 TaxID=2976007 RepID=UPI002E357ECC|nr:alpha/beta fold hydrolase [Spirillospora sp. NBC_01491]
MADPVAPPPLWTRFAGGAADPRVVLLCLPFAGGGALAYRTWARALGPDGVAVWPVQLPGREDRFEEDAYEDLPALVSTLLAEFGPRLDGRPYALFGHSMGGGIALELAWEARRRGMPEPVRMFLSASRPPNRPDPDAPRYDLPRDRFVEQLRKYDATSVLLDRPDLLEVFLPKLRADFALVERHRYRSEPPLACPFTVLGGLDDGAVPPNVLPAWADYTSGGTEVRLVGGPHFFLESARDVVLKVIRTRLESVAAA